MARIFFFTVFCILSLGASAVLAQNSAETNEIKAINKGVVNGSAISLAKPAYPPAAKAVRAEGAVSVQVTIDEEGNVISAIAKSGHPLLQAAAVEAARQSKFKPTLLQGEAVKVTGVIVYNFVADRSDSAENSNWYNAGRTLATLEKGASLRYSYPAGLTNLLQKDWTPERENLQRLDELRKLEFEAVKNSPDAVKENAVEKVQVQSDGTQRVVKVIESQISVSVKPNPEQIAIAQNLISALQSRLAVNQTDLWNFNLGATVARAVASGKNSDEMKRGAQDLRYHIQSAPNGIAPELINELNKLAAILEGDNFSPENRSELSGVLFNINRLQSSKKQ